MSKFLKGLKDFGEEVAPAVAGIGAGLATYTATVGEVGPVFAFEAGTAAGGAVYKGTEKFIQDVDPKTSPPAQAKVKTSSLSALKPSPSTKSMLDKPAPKHPFDSVSYTAKVEPT
jgi:hypothetical protein